jgi:Carboxypeptidase regulatory-like domain/TonB dependent receptor
MKSIRAGAALAMAGVMLFLVVGASDLKAQVASGSILGVASDTSGAVVANASISCTSVETGVVRKAVTDGTGAYSFPALPVGNYDLEASSQGFKTEIRRGIAVTVGASVAVSFTLTVGATEQSVEVTAEAPQVNTTDASVGGLVSETAIRSLPLNGRDWLQLATLQPGVTGGIGQSPVTGGGRAATGNGLFLSIAGGRPTDNVFTVDNLIVNDYANASPGSGLGVNLGVEGIREFRVLTEEYTAQYGRTSGGVVNAVYKSGTNQFHGGLFEFLRNSALDAPNFFDNVGGTTKPPFRRNQFGASIGGPIKKDKTFFFANYESLREVEGGSDSSNTLSLNARQGILTTGNVTVSPSVVPYLAVFPLPNGAVNGDTAKFNFGALLVGTENYGVAKLDHYFTDRTTISGSFQADDAVLAQPDLFDEKMIGGPSRHYNGVVNFQHTFSPTLLNNARVGVSRTIAHDSFDASAINPIVNDTSLGFLAGLPAGIITISGLTNFAGGMGASGADVFQYTSFQGGDDVTWTKGRNTFMFGGTVDRIRDNKTSVNVPLGEFDFNTISGFLTADLGNDATVFTLDLPGTNNIRGLRNTYLGVYAQDEIAVRRNLKLNVGLRYEYLSGTTEQFGRVSVLPTLDAAVPRLGGSYFNPTTKNFAPRLGLAWDPTGSGKTAVRAGYGIYDVLPLPYLVVNDTNAAPFFEEGVVTCAPGPTPCSFPAAPIGLIGPHGLRAAYLPATPPRAYDQQWNLTVQRQLAANTTLMVGYLGAHSVHLPRRIDDVDEVPASQITVAPDGNLAFPCAPVIAGACTGATILNTNWHKISSVFWDDTATYNAFVTAFSQRFSHGLYFQAAYTYAHGMDEGSQSFSESQGNAAPSPYTLLASLNKGDSDFDIRHNFVFNFTYAIPSPHSANGVVKSVFAGWEFGGIFTAQTGSPFSVYIRGDQANTGTAQQDLERPNFNPGPGCSTNAINPGNPSNYINLQCFSFPNPGELGNLGRNTLRGPSLLDFDPSLAKTWGFDRERMKLQFRAEFFNILNRTNFFEPSQEIFDGSGNLEPVGAQLGPPTATTSRQIQFGLKLNW